MKNSLSHLDFFLPVSMKKTKNLYYSLLCSRKILDMEIGNGTWVRFKIYVNHGILIGGEGDCYFLEQLPKNPECFLNILKMMKLIFAIFISAVPDEHNFFFFSNYKLYLTLNSRKLY